MSSTAQAENLVSCSIQAKKGINTNSVTLNGLSVDKYRYIWKADLEPAGLKFQWETNK